MACIVILRQSFLMSRNVMVIEIKRKQPLLTVLPFTCLCVILFIYCPYNLIDKGITILFNRVF